MTLTYPPLVSRKPRLVNPAYSYSSRLAYALMLGVAAVLAGAILMGCWLVTWLLAASLVGFLLGPDSWPALHLLPLPFFLLPPFAMSVGSLVIVWWFTASGRWKWQGTTDGSAELSYPQDGTLLPSVLWTVGLLVAGSLAYLGYARLIFIYHRIQGGIDEGVYLYAARLVMSGQVLYRDFHYNQGPLLPYLVGPVLAPFEFHEAAARVFAIVCALATLLVTFIAAHRLGGRLAGLLAFALLLTNLDFITEISAGVQANGSLTALVVALTALALAVERTGMALGLAAVAAGIRLTFAPFPVVVGSYLALVERRPRLALVGGLLLGCLIFGTFLLLGGERAVFSLFSNVERAEVLERWYGLAKGLRPHLISTRNGVIDIVGPYLPFFLGAIPATYLVWTRQHPRWRVLATLGVSSLAVLLVNVLPYPVNPRYPVTELPLLAVFDGVALAAVVHRLAAHLQWRPAAHLVLVMTAVLLAAAPRLASREANFIDWYRKDPPLESLEEVSTYVRGLGGPDATLLTVETPVATESGLRVLPGLEYGSWAIVRGWSDERARAVGMVTFEMLIDMVERREGDIIVTSDRYGLAENFAPTDAQQDRMKAALKRGYVLREVFNHVSDWGDVRVYTRRTP